MSSVAQATSSAASMASSVASSAASSAASAASAAANIKLSSASFSADKDDEAYIGLLKELKYTTELSQERNEIFQKFQELLQSNESTLRMGVFIVDMKRRGFSVQWADAAFRTFDVQGKGSLNRYEYLLAISALQVDKRLVRIPKWLDLRRRLIFMFYDRGAKGFLEQSDFIEFLLDASQAESIESCGILNSDWANISEVDGSEHSLAA
jgi:hypothetical protein